jgi:hypothetical protein
VEVTALCRVAGSACPAPVHLRQRKPNEFPMHGSRQMHEGISGETSDDKTRIEWRGPPFARFPAFHVL